MLGVIDDAFDTAKDAFEGPVNAVLDGFEGAANTAESIGEFVYDAIESGIEAVLELKDEVLEKLDDATRALVEIGKALARAVEDVTKIVDGIASAIDSGLDAIKRAAEGALLDAFDFMASAVEWVEKNLPDPVDWVLNDVLPAAWGALKLIAAVAGLLATWPAFLAAAFICNLIAENYGHEYGTVIEAVLRGDKRYQEMFRIVRLPARRNYVIVSDIHRWANNDEQEAGFLHDSRELFDRVMEHYGIEEWALIENGDVEDYWLRGGGLYGVAYDVASMMPGPVLDGKVLDGGLATAAQFHLGKIMRTHASTYARLKALFHNKQRYFRTVGNHDDVNSRPEMQAVLRRMFPGLQVADYIVLQEPNGRGAAAIAHGHQTDAWNYGACSFLGRTTTSLASGLRDLPFIPSSLGVPDKTVSDALWNSGGMDLLDQVGPFGADPDLGSLDEVALFESCRRIWGGAGPDIAKGPWLLLGHTHVPLWKPANPETNGVWRRYVNSGCCVFSRMITTIEWVYQDGMAEPEVRLVAWRWAKDVGAVPPEREREIVARRLIAYNSSRRLASDGVDYRFNHPVPV